MEMLPNIPLYEILEELGRGSTGIVFKVRDKEVHRVAALKTLIPMSGHERIVRSQRFLREARCNACCRHPNIVQVFQVGDYTGQPYILREFVDGEALQAILQKNVFSAREACKIVEILTKAMQCVHSQGLIHHNLTPANVLMATDGTLKLIGFSKVRAMDDASSPESVGTDIQALGVMLYHLMTREYWLPEGRLPDELTKICLRCSNAEPEKQYQNVSELAADLRRYLG